MALDEDQERRLRLNVAVRASECGTTHREAEAALRWLQGTVEKAEKVLAGDVFYDGNGHGARMDALIAELALRRAALNAAVELAEGFGLDVQKDIELGGVSDAARGRRR